MTARLCSCWSCLNEPTNEEVEWVLREMDRYGSSRGWVLWCALKRAQRHERQPVDRPLSEATG